MFSVQVICSDCGCIKSVAVHIDGFRSCNGRDRVVGDEDFADNTRITLARLGEKLVPGLSIHSDSDHIRYGETIIEEIMFLPVRCRKHISDFRHRVKDCSTDVR